MVAFGGGLLAGIAVFGVLPELAEGYGWGGGSLMLASGFGLLWVVNRYIYDGDGNRVARLGLDNRGTVFIGNYFEAVYPHNIIPDPPPLVTEGGGEENEPSIGRFMQADTIVPPTQGTQAFDRYAYVNNCPSVNSGITPAWASVIVTSASKIHLLNAVGSLRSQIHAIRFRVEQFYKLWMIVRSKLKKVSPAAVHARRVSAGPSEPLLE